MEAQLLVLAKSIYYCNWRRRLYFFTVCDSIQTQTTKMDIVEVNINGFIDDWLV